MASAKELFRVVEFPDDESLAAFGLINIGWAHLDAIVTSVMVDTMKADPVELGVLVGQLESTAKLKKLEKILLHRKDKTRSAVVRKVYKDLDKARSLRNAITHGAYIGHEDNDKFFFKLMASFLVPDEKNPSAIELFTITVDEIHKHVATINAARKSLLEHFDSAEQRKLFSLPTRAASKTEKATQTPRQKTR